MPKVNIKKHLSIFSIFYFFFSASLAHTSTPFGTNNLFDQSQEDTDQLIKDLGVGVVSDHIARRAIEKEVQNSIKYDWSKVDAQLTEYIKESDVEVWLIINIETRLKHADGRKISGGKKSSSGKYIPEGPVSYEAYGKFLDDLLDRVEKIAPGKKVKYWSVDNEQASIYVPAYCGKEDIDEECGQKGAQAYADLVEFTYKRIKAKDSEAKIVFGGPGGGTPNHEYQFFYKPAFEALHAKAAHGYFDFWDYHNFNTYKDYKTNSRDKDIDFFKQILAKSGFPNKPILIKAGGTHSGQDLLSKNKRLKEYQTEAEQAEHLIKRAIYHVGEGIPIILYDAGIEDSTPHSTFSMTGSIYNGVPKQGDCDPQKESPCPDPGLGIKKLGYYAYKFLNAKFQGVDPATAKKIPTSDDDVYLYEFQREGNPIYVAWWDYWSVSHTQTKKITVDVPLISKSSSKITKAIPSFQGPFQTKLNHLNADQYPKFFSFYSVRVENHRITINLDHSPIYIE